MAILEGIPLRRTGQENIGSAVVPSGQSIAVAETAFYEVVDGRFKRMWHLMDIDSLRTQLAA